MSGTWHGAVQGNNRELFKRNSSNLCYNSSFIALDENEKFNPTAYKDFINMLIEAGVHGIFPLGTNGEFYAFNNDEKYEIIKTAVEAVNGRVPVYAGTGCVTTKETIEFSLKVKDLGVDCLSVISPYFVSVSQEDIYNHFSAVAKAVDMPILLYNVLC